MRALGSPKFWAGLWGLGWWLGFSGVLAVIFSRVSEFGDGEGLWNVTWVTWKQAVLSTGLSAVLGIPVAFFLARPDRLPARVRRYVRAALQVPAALPTLVIITLAVRFGGAQGGLTQLISSLSGGRWPGEEAAFLYRMETVIAIHVFLNATWLAAGVLLALDRLPRAQEEVLRTLGASRWQCFRSWFLPALSGTLRAQLLQVYLWCASSFAIVVLLGGGPPVETLETTLYSKLRMGNLDLSGAALVAALQLLSTLPIWLLLRGFWLGRSGSEERFRFPAAVRLDRGSWSVGGGLMLLGMAIAGGPLLFALLQSALQLGSYDPTRFFYSFGLSLRIAVGAAGGALVCGLVWVLVAREPSWRRWAWMSAELPSGFSPLVLGFGFWLATSRWIDPFAGVGWVPAVILGVLQTPLVFRQLQPHADQSPRGHHEILRVLGASAWQRFLRVEWPRWPSLLASVFTGAVALALGEVSLVSLFAGEGLRPVALEVSQGMARYRFEEAAVWSAALGVAVVGIFGVSAALRPRRRSLKS